jgi:hypothetical protein
MENFVHEQNVLRFSERLKTETDPTARTRVRQLLLDEENKFAATAERLDKTDGHIASCKEHITRQYGLIDRLNGEGRDVGPAQRLLENLLDLHDLFVSYRRLVSESLNRVELS